MFGIFRVISYIYHIRGGMFGFWKAWEKCESRPVMLAAGRLKYVRDDTLPVGPALRKFIVRYRFAP